MKKRVEIDLNGIVIIVGNYGSGKTEVSINLAVNQRQRGRAVRVADLDLVNFYFRTREALHFLNGLGIDMVLPGTEYLNADLPILVPAVAGVIRESVGLTLLDVGGDDAGATVLSALADAFADQPYRMLQVVNPYRPNTNTVSGCMKIRKEIEGASGMTINGIIGNANLIEETTIDTIREGYDFVSRLSEETKLPLEFITAENRLLSEMDVEVVRCPILGLNRQLSPPWLRA